MQEAIRQAETEYSVRAHELDPKYFERHGWGRVTTNEILKRRLATVWAYTPHGQNLLRIAEKTGCGELERFIYSLRSFPQVKPAQIFV